MKTFELAGRDVEPVDPANFTGGGTLVRMTGVSQAPNVNAYRVTFEPGARTAWHTHTGPQLLLVTEGTCRCQTDGGAIEEVAAGGLVSFEPGERHWHGATPEEPMTHVAINIEASTTWLDQVSDEEYVGSSG
ncbi:MAG TPA: cupin domain-containing protein [Longimicrobiales bacterium]|nr:cupin domain-containing protein [Longimicrobiales bacterium]